MRTIFRSLRTRNYRLFFAGQLVSISGTWMQTIAQDWLVLKLTSSGIALGVNTALQFGPMLLAGMWGGLVADRLPKRRVLLVTQMLFLCQALTLGVLVAGGWAQLWMVYALSLFFGMVQVIDVPARQAFASELVGTAEVMNAVSLNSAVFNSGRIVGPAVAGVTIATAGLPVAFFVNAASYVAVIAALTMMRESELFAGRRADAGRGQLRAAVRYIRTTPDLLLPLVMMAVIGTFGLNFRTLIPLLARFTFHAGATVYGTLSSVMAIGSLLGSLFAASRKVPTRKLLVGAGVAFGATEAAAGFVPSLPVAYVVLPAVGLFGMLFIATTNSMLQVTSSDEMRGRVLSLYALLFLGSTPIGGPIMGWIAQTWSARAGLVVGGVASFLTASITGAVLLRRRRVTRRAELRERVPVPAGRL